MERAYTWCDGKRLEVTAKTLIMGILNVTPDSFSDGGRWNTAEKAQSHTREMTDAGADIIDVGAESTRPGGQPLTAEEEIEGMKIFLPVVLWESSVPVSVDTYHWKTADYALHAGAHMMNDIWGLQYDHGEMAEVAGCHQVPVIVMHNKADTNYNGDIIEEMKIFLEVNQKNLNAIKLYKKNNFEEISVRKNYYGLNEDALIMVKSLKK